MNMIHELQFDKWCGEIFFIDIFFTSSHKDQKFCWDLKDEVPRKLINGSNIGPYLGNKA